MRTYGGDGPLDAPVTRARYRERYRWRIAVAAGSTSGIRFYGVNTLIPEARSLCADNWNSLKRPADARGKRSDSRNEKRNLALALINANFRVA